MASLYDYLARSQLEKQYSSPLDLIEQGRERARGYEQRQKMEDFGGLLSEELALESPNVQRIASAQAMVDPLGALKTAGVGATQGRQTDFQLKAQKLAEAEEVGKQAIGLTNKIRSNLNNPDYVIGPDLAKLQELQLEYSTKSGGRRLRLDPTDEKKFQLKLDADRRAQKSLGLQQAQFAFKKKEAEEAKEIEKEKRYEKSLGTLNIIEDLKADKEAGRMDMGNIGFGVASIIKDISGAGVSDNERINLLLNVVNDDYAKEFRSKGTGLQNAFMRGLINNDQELINEITRNADQQKIIDQLERGVSKGAKKWYTDTQKEPEKKTGRFSGF